MALLTIAELKEHVETDLTDPALQRILDAAEQHIIAVAGTHPAATLTEFFETKGHVGGAQRHIFMGREIGAVTAIAERERHDGAETTLATDDWRQWGDRELVRLRNGTNPRLFWAPIVKVSYTPRDDLALRKHVQLQLAQLGLNYCGVQSEGAGDFTVNFGALSAQDEKVRAVLSPLFAGRFAVR